MLLKGRYSFLLALLSASLRVPSGAQVGGGPDSIKSTDARHSNVSWNLLGCIEILDQAGVASLHPQVQDDDVFLIAPQYMRVRFEEC